MATCVGIEGRNQMIYQHNGSYVQKSMENWIDQLFIDHAGSVTDVHGDGSVQQIAMTDPTLKLWSTDQVGLPQERQVTLVQRTDVSKLPAGSFTLSRFLTQNGTSVVIGSDTPLVTRVNNEVGSIPANQWQSVNEDPHWMLGCNMWGYVLRTSGPQLVQFAVRDYMPVPDVISATWGVMNITRGDAASLVEVCDNYPESVDPGDRAVFDNVLTELIQYDPVHEIRDETTQYKGKYLYWVDTDWGNFASYANSFLAGVPHISPLFTPPLDEEKMSSAKHKGNADVHDVLKSFEKDGDVKHEEANENA